MYRVYLRWYFIIGIFFTLFVLSWLLLTPSLSTEVFLFHYSFRRFILNLAVITFLVFELFSLLLINTKFVNSLFDWFLNSTNVFWLVIGSYFVVWGMILFGCLFVLLGGKNILFEQLLPILGLIYILLLGLVIILWITSKGEKLRPIIQSLVWVVSLSKHIGNLIILGIKMIPNLTKKNAQSGQLLTELIPTIDKTIFGILSGLYKYFH